MNRTAKTFLDEMLAKNSDPLRVLAVARTVRGGIWYDEVLEMLLSSGKISKPEIDGAREKASQVLRDRWKTERISEIRRVADEKALRDRRAALKREHEA